MELNTVLAMKKAIDNIGCHIRPCGVNQSSLYFLSDNRDEEKLEHLEVSKYLSKQRIAKKNVYQGKIELKEPVVTLREDLAELEDWKEVSLAASPSSYGDMTTVETKTDSSVRSSRELLASEFEVSPELLESIQTNWKKSMYPPNVRVQPHKLLFYGENDFFSLHTDTPAQDLVGTVCILVHRDDKYFKHHLSFPGERTSWPSWSENNFVAFYNNVPHLVKNQETFRVTLVFKIWAEQEQIDRIDQFVVSSVQSHLLKVSETHRIFGILSHHLYSYNSKPLKGTDYILTQAIEGLKVQSTCLTVILTSSVDKSPEYGNSDQSTDCNVYPLTEEHLKFLMSDSDSEPPKFPYKSVDFFYFGSPRSIGTNWSKQTQKEAFLGNEAQPYQMDSVDLTKAWVIEFPMREGGDFRVGGDKEGEEGAKSEEILSDDEHMENNRDTEDE